MIASTTIDGFTVEISPNLDRPGKDCHVSSGSYGASLACLEREGVVYDGDRERRVAASTIHRIQVWAAKHGYGEG